MGPESSAQTAEGPPPFTATAAARGAAVQVTLPGAPATDAPVDASGPAAQALVNSLSTSQAYAAFPFPGELVVGAPGLITGFLAAGGFPVDLPTLPSYPFVASSDATTNAEDTVGAGPYELRAHSERDRSEARGTGGLRLEAAGNAALVEASATVEIESDGGVVAEAVSDAQALTVGPLTIGQIRSVATARLDKFGTVTTETSLSVAGLRIGGIPVEVRTDGLGVGEALVPLHVGSTLDSILAGAGIHLEFVPAQPTTSGVVGEALQISMPVDGSLAGAREGTMTVTLGSVSVDLSPGATAPSVRSAPASVAPPVSLTSPPEAGRGSAAGAGSVPTTGGTPTTASPSVSTVGGDRIVSFDIPGFDIRSLYLVVLVLSSALLGMGQFVRVVGVRMPWRSVDG